jgi:hypothetical protein
MHQSQGGNVYIGSRAGGEATNGQQNVYIGEACGLKTTYGKSNVFIGHQSGMNITGDAGVAEKGSYNVFMGFQAGQLGTTIKQNVFIGYQAGKNTIAGTTSDEGNYNVFLGSEAGLSNQTGRANTAIGEQALKSNTTGYWNVAIGKSPLVSNTTGYLNIAIGNASLQKNQDGIGNIAIGSTALNNHVTGDGNIAIGSGALFNALDSTNVAVGSQSMTLLKSGAFNTAIGYQTNVYNTSGLPLSYSNSTAIGYLANINASNQVILGNPDITTFFCAGAYAATTAFQPNMHVNSSGQIMRSTTALSGSGAANKVAIWTNTYELNNNTNLHWDNSNSRLGIGTNAPLYSLDVAGPINIAKGMSSAIALYVNNVEAIWSNGTRFNWGFGGTYNYFADKVGIGTTGTTGGALNIEGSAPVVHLKYNSTSGGQAIRFENNNGVQGNIYILATTGVTYNGFTGSHFANIDEKAEMGMLISLTGNNTYINAKDNSEIIYGGKISTQPNSRDILGAFIENIELDGNKRSNLVMAVGNGVMLVIDNGENLEIGDYLISSSIAGHAMKDKGEYPLSNIIARVAEPVNWENESQMINGVKHKLISVFFENFSIERSNNAGLEINTLKDENQKLKKELTEIKNEIDLIKSQLKK